MAYDIVSILLFIAAFWGILYILAKIFVWEKRGIIVGPFYAMLKTSFLNERLKFFLKKEKFWRAFWNIGVVFAFGLMVYAVYFLSNNIIELVNRTPQAAGFIPVIPLVTISLETLPYILIALALVLITHELAHAIAGLVDNIPLKSAGLFIVFIMPVGAFVEPDEEKLEKASLATKLRVFSAGSFTNFIAFAIVFLLFINFSATISPFYSGPSGILVSGVIEDGGASQADLKKWDVIYSINGQPIKDINALAEFMSQVKPGTTLILSTDRGEVNVVTKPHPQDPTRALIGINPFFHYEPRWDFAPKELPYHLYFSQYWMQAIFLIVAILNMLPLFPFDGDKVVYSLVSSKSKKAARIIRVGVGGVFLVVLVMNFALSYMNFGLIRI